MDKNVTNRTHLQADPVVELALVGVEVLAPLSVVLLPNAFTVSFAIYKHKS